MSGPEPDRVARARHRVAVLHQVAAEAQDLLAQPWRAGAALSPAEAHTLLWQILGRARADAELLEVALAWLAAVESGRRPA